MRVYYCISQCDFTFDDTQVTAESTYSNSDSPYTWTHDADKKIILQAPFIDDIEIKEAK